MRPSNPASRAASAALAPARLAPTIASVRVVMAGLLSRAWCGPSPAHAGEGEELGPGAVVLAEQAVHRGGDGERSRGLDAAERHAEVLGLEHHAHALGGEVLLEPVRDLLREALLHLQVA